MSAPRWTCVPAVLAALTGLTGCRGVNPVPNDRWTVSEPIFAPLEQGVFENVAVKDPSIVYYDGAYHLFYTGKRAEQTADGVRYDIATGYVTAPTLAGLQDATRYNLSAMVDATVIAPQVFYFAPRKLWYLIAHRYDHGNRPNLHPIFLTNPDIRDVHGWSRPRDLVTAKRTDGFWIDFWVICDDAKAHLFSMDQTGNVLRMECPIDTFPEGLATAVDTVAVPELRGENDTGTWVAFEAEHVYRVRQPETYLMILEGGYYQASRKYFADARRRFLIGLTADRLEGPWRQIAGEDGSFLAEAGNLYDADGRPSALSQVSHFELVRSGYDEKLEIDDFDLDVIFQSFDGSKWPDSYNYNELPWILSIMRNRDARSPDASRKSSGGNR